MHVRRPRSDESYFEIEPLHYNVGVSHHVTMDGTEMNPEFKKKKNPIGFAPKKKRTRKR